MFPIDRLILLAAVLLIAGIVSIKRVLGHEEA